MTMLDSVTVHSNDPSKRRVTVYEDSTGVDVMIIPIPVNYPVDIATRAAESAAYAAIAVLSVG
jgi:hypothetical protein